MRQLDRKKACLIEKETLVSKHCTIHIIMYDLTYKTVYYFYYLNQRNTLKKSNADSLWHSKIC